jgi:hypothetical protein
MLMKLFAAPATYFKELAPAYKEVEPVMEEQFQRSRYVKPKI